MKALPNAPNNLGPTLLIVLGACMTPFVVGFPILLFALSQLKTKDGYRTYAYLTPRLLPSIKIHTKP